MWTDFFNEVFQHSLSRVQLVNTLKFFFNMNHARSI